MIKFNLALSTLQRAMISRTCRFNYNSTPSQQRRNNFNVSFLWIKTIWLISTRRSRNSHIKIRNESNLDLPSTTFHSLPTSSRMQLVKRRSNLKRFRQIIHHPSTSNSTIRNARKSMVNKLAADQLVNSRVTFTHRNRWFWHSLTWLEVSKLFRRVVKAR